jgi:hypothetical protein
MPTLPTLSGAAALQDSLKPSETTATLPGAVDGGTNLSAAFAETLPQTSSERSLLSSMEASVSSGIGGVTGVTGLKFSDAARGAQDAASAVAATWTKGIQNLKLGDVSSKLTEGAYSLVGKFSASAGPFGKLAVGAASFAGLSSPKEIGKTGAGALTAGQKGAAAASNLGQVSAAQANAAQQANEEDKTYLVTLTDDEGFSVVFQILPEIVENRSIRYQAVQPPQFPGAFQKYEGTDSVQWSVNAVLVCRTTKEATVNLMYLNRLRGWTMPFFGEAMAKSPLTILNDKVGAPPPVLRFHGLRTNVIGPVPVVITSLNWSWPRDVDYIPAQKLDSSSYADDYGNPRMVGDATVPFPAVISISIQLVESFSIAEFNGFDLEAYRVGDFENAYKSKPQSADVDQQPTGEEAQKQMSSGPAALQSVGPLASVSAFPALPKLPPLPNMISEAKKSNRPFLGRVSQMFKDKKGWDGPEPGHKDTLTGF